MVKWKSDEKQNALFFQFLVVKPNEHQIEEIKIRKEIGVTRFVLKRHRYMITKRSASVDPRHNKYSRYKRRVR